MYKEATRKKLRWTTAKGVLSVEQLWDLSLIQLNEIAKSLNKSLKESKEEDFITIKSKEDAELSLRFNIVKDIIDSKLKEKEEEAVKVEKAQKRQQILELIYKKQNEVLESKSLEELKKELENIG